MLREIRGGNDFFRQRDFIIFEEYHFKLPGNLRVTVNFSGNGINQLNNQLCHPIAWRRFTRKQMHLWRDSTPVLFDIQIQRDHVQNIEQLALVFMNTFDLTVKHRQRIQRDAVALSHQLAECGFIGKFYGPDTLNHGWLAGQIFQAGKQG